MTHPVENEKGVGKIYTPDRKGENRMNELMTYVSKEFGPVRAIEIDGEPWLIGKDVAEALGYSDTDQAIRRHVDEEDKLTRSFDGSGQNREMYIINESGLFSLVLSSKLPGAKKFKRWVTSEVLPTIRRQGYYSTMPPEQLAKALLDAMNDEWKLKNLVIPTMQAADVNQCMLVAQYMGLTTEEFNNNPKLIKKSNKNLGAKNVLKSWERHGWEKYTMDDLPEEYRDRPQAMLAIEKASKKSGCYGWFAEYCGKMYFNKSGYEAVIEQMKKMGYITDSKAAEWKRELETQAP